MYEILHKEEMAKRTIVKFVIDAPQIAKKTQPGQFVVLRVNETGERVPLTIADNDPFAGTITIIFQIIGKTTALLRSLNTGDFIKDVVGPLGHPTEMFANKTIAIVGGGTGVAVVHNMTKGLRANNNFLIGIIGARTKDLLILEDEMKSLCDELVVTTDDGSYGTPGFVTQVLEKYLQERDDIEVVFTAGPVIMMEIVTKVTAKYNVKTIASLNPIMVDGTGMCGACRVTVGGETKFCCVDGPDFDAHQVDFTQLKLRLQAYLKQEKDSLLFSIR